MSGSRASFAKALRPKKIGRKVVEEIHCLWLFRCGGFGMLAFALTSTKQVKYVSMFLHFYFLIVLEKYRIKYKVSML